MRLDTLALFRVDRSLHLVLEVVRGEGTLCRLQYLLGH